MVKEGRVTGEIVWLDANREEDAIIAQANAKLNPDGTFVEDLVLSRKRGDLPLEPPANIDYMDVAPEQLVSIAAALIPFRRRRRQPRAHGLEHAASGRAAAQPAHAAGGHGSSHGGRRLRRE